jgi:hypothetical protein
MEVEVGTGRPKAGWGSDALRVAASSSAAILLPPAASLAALTTTITKPDVHGATHSPKAEIILAPTHVRSNRTGSPDPTLVTWRRGSRSLRATDICSSLILC